MRDEQVTLDQFAHSRFIEQLLSRVKDVTLGRLHLGNNSDEVLHGEPVIRLVSFDGQGSSWPEHPRYSSRERLARSSAAKVFKTR
jgi:hypothetical protein